MKNSRRILINTSFFFTFAVFAISYTISAPIFIEISQRIGMDINNMGSVFSYYFAGFMLGGFLSSLAKNFLLRKRLLAFFNFLLSLGVLSLAFSANYLLFVSAYLLIGLSGGFIESQISILLMEANENNEGFFINLAQVFFGVGAFVGPLLPITLINAGIDWKYSYVAAASLCFINLFLFLFVNIKETDLGKTINGESTIKVGKIKNVGLLILLMLAMFFYIYSEVGLAAWIPTFLRLDRSFTKVLAAQVLSFFWLAFIPGRLLAGFLTRKVRPLYILLVVIVLSIISIIAGIYARNNFLIILSFILTGFFLSSMWPLLVTIGGLFFPRRRNVVVSVIILSGGAGGLVAPMLLGIIYENFDLFTLMNANYLFLIVTLALVLGLFFYKRKKIPENI